MIHVEIGLKGIKEVRIETTSNIERQFDYLALPIVKRSLIRLNAALRKDAKKLNRLIEAAKNE